MNTHVIPDQTPKPALAIVQRYEGAVNYLYPLLHALVESFAASTMGLRFSHWSVQPVSMGANFCGYRIWPTHKLLRRRSVAAAKKKIVRYRKAGDEQALDRFVASWRGHAQWANTFNLLNRLGVAA